MKYSYGFVGCGNMGGAILSCLADMHPDEKILAYDISDDKSAGFAKAYENVSQGNLADVLNECDYVFLGLKPQVLPAFLNENIEKSRKYENTFVTMAAGTAIEKVSAYFSDGVKIIRIMPNIPVSVGQGTILFCHNGFVSEEQSKCFAKKMACTGLVIPVDEGRIDAGSAISGCGPAFVYMFIEALADGGVQCGLTREQATQLAAQTVMGSAKQVLESGVHPDELKDRVCSPGGTTIAGVHALEENAFRFASSEAVIRAYQKTLSLK